MYCDFLLEGILVQDLWSLTKENNKNVPVCKELHKIIYNNF